MPSGASRLLGAAVGAAVSAGDANGQHAPDEWYYIDMHAQEQGPFPLQSMKEWYKAGYFTAAQQAKCGKVGTFRYFAEIPAVTGVEPTPNVVEPWKKVGLVDAARDKLQAGLGSVLEAQQQSVADTTAYSKGRAPTWGSKDWEHEQERRDQFQQAQAAQLMQMRAKVENAAESRKVGAAQAAVAAAGSDPLALAATASLTPSVGVAAAAAAAKIKNKNKKKAGGGSFMGSLKSSLQKARQTDTGGMGIAQASLGLDARTEAALHGRCG